MKHLLILFLFYTSSLPCFSSYSSFDNYFGRERSTSIPLQPTITISHDLKNSRALETIFSLPRKSFDTWTSLGVKRSKSLSDRPFEIRNKTLKIGQHEQGDGNNFLVICFSPYEAVGGVKDYSPFFSAATNNLISQGNTLYISTGNRPHGFNTIAGRKGVFAIAWDWLNEKKFFRNSHLKLVLVGLGEGGIRGKEFLAYLLGKTNYPAPSYDPVVWEHKIAGLITMNSPHHGSKASSSFRRSMQVDASNRGYAFLRTVLTKTRCFDRLVPMLAMRPGSYRWQNYWFETAPLPLAISITNIEDTLVSDDETSPWGPKSHDESGKILQGNHLANMNVHIKHEGFGNKAQHSLGTFDPENRVSRSILKKSLVLAIQIAKEEKNEGL